MDLATLIRSRRTITNFSGEPIPDGLVEELLETAVYAPNHRLTEPWRFLYLRGNGVLGYAEARKTMAIQALQTDDPALIEKVGEAAYRKFASVPGILIISMMPNSDLEIREEDYAACAALTQNLLLLAWERGLGSAWKTFKDAPLLRRYLGLAEQEKVVSVVHLGYPANQPAGQRKPARAVLRHMR
jgi:nitroreductase